MNSSFTEHFRCPDSLVRIHSASASTGDSGYFRFGEDVVCFGRTDYGTPASRVEQQIYDALPDVKLGRHEIHVPFDLDQVARNLRCEFYAGHMGQNETHLPPHPVIRNLYYWARPLMPIGFRKLLQRARLRGEIANPFPRWPVDRTVDRLFETLMTLAIRSGGNAPVPFIWFWPDGAQAALILTHDVETNVGRNFCKNLMDLDDTFGFKSSFQIVPQERYDVTEAFLERFRQRGFEVNVHDLNHDGNLFRTHDEFRLRAKKINEYARQFGTSGFRSGALYRNLRWYNSFEFSYDMSVPNVGHLDPQGGGCCTVFPYLVGNLLEIPVTATQDYSLFHILNTYSLDLWKEQCQLILNGHGLVSIIVHPDYIIGKKPRETYRQLLQHLTGLCAANKIWSTLPREIDRWWRSRLAMKLVRQGNTWRIEGEGKERARIAYAHLVDGRLSYSFDPVHAEEDVFVNESVVPSIEVSSTPLCDSATQMACASDLAATAQLKQSTIDTSSTKSTIPLVAEESTSVEMPVLELEKPSSSSPTCFSPQAHSGRKRLRVCMVTYSFYEHDNRVMRYAETLALRGDEVDVFALQRDERPREEILNGVHLHRLQSRKINEKSRFSYLGRILQFLLRAMYHVSRNHLRQKYDLLHIHSVPDFMVFAGWLPRMNGTPVVLDIHDILPEFYTSKFGSGQHTAAFRLLQIVEKISARFSSHVIIANHIWQERLLSRSVEAGKCTVVLNSPDRSIFSANGAKVANKRFVMLYPGTLNWHQGLDLAIRAFARISDQVPQADFHIYGDGPTKEDLEALIHELHLENRIFICMPLPLREVAKVIASADLGIVPKRKDTFGNEAFSTKILEFMAMGVPVIVSDTQVDRYYFDDSVVRFFRGGEEDDLARSMLEMIRNPQRRETMVRNATKFVEQMDWTAKRHEYLELVDRLASSAKGPR
jgi:glycosyltransferase involved in cell wall biosynthesis